jgi:hypothetical protein
VLGVFVGAGKTEVSHLLASGDRTGAQDYVWTGTCLTHQEHF